MTELDGSSCPECGLPIVECSALAIARNKVNEYLRLHGYSGLDAWAAAARLISVPKVGTVPTLQRAALNPEVFEHQVCGYIVRRDAEGAWTVTPPASHWGYDCPEDYEREEGFPIETLSLEVAGFAYAPDMGKLVQALVEELKSLQRGVDGERLLSAAPNDAVAGKPV